MKKILKDSFPFSTKKYASSIQNALRKSKRAEKLMPALKTIASDYGISRLSRLSGVDRAHLYTLLAAEGDPRLTTLTAILDTLGFKLDICVKKKHLH